MRANRFMMRLRKTRSSLSKDDWMLFFPHSSDSANRFDPEWLRRVQLPTTAQASIYSISVNIPTSQFGLRPFIYRWIQKRLPELSMVVPVPCLRQKQEEIKGRETQNRANGRSIAASYLKPVCLFFAGKLLSFFTLLMRFCANCSLYAFS